MIALCEDDSVIGAPFYVMERVAARRTAGPSQLEALGADRTRAITERMVDTLVDLHAVDHRRRRPGRLRPARRLPRASGRAAGRSSSTPPAAARSPGMDELVAQLERQHPDRRRRHDRARRLPARQPARRRGRRPRQRGARLGDEHPGRPAHRRRRAAGLPAARRGSPGREPSGVGGHGHRRAAGTRLPVRATRSLERYARAVRTRRQRPRTSTWRSPSSSSPSSSRASTSGTRTARRSAAGFDGIGDLIDAAGRRGTTRQPVNAS